MTRPRFALAFVLAIVTLPLASAQDPGTVDLSTVSSQWEARYNEADLDALVELYTKDTTLMPPNAPEAGGRDAVRANVQAYLDAGAARAEIGSPTASGAMGDEAWGAGPYRFFSEGGDPVAAGKYLIMYRRVAGAWLIERHMWNSDLPPVAPPPGS